MAQTVNLQLCCDLFCILDKVLSIPVGYFDVELLLLAQGRQRYNIELHKAWGGSRCDHFEETALLLYDTIVNGTCLQKGCDHLPSESL